MKRFVAILFFLLLAFSASAQTINGKSPFDKVLPSFFQQNNNANTTIDGLNANATHQINWSLINSLGAAGLITNLVATNGTSTIINQTLYLNSSGLNGVTTTNSGPHTVIAGTLFINTNSLPPYAVTNNQSVISGNLPIFNSMASVSDSGMSLSSVVTNTPQAALVTGIQTDNWIYRSNNQPGTVLDASVGLKHLSYSGVWWSALTNGTMLFGVPTTNTSGTSVVTSSGNTAILSLWGQGGGQQINLESTPAGLAIGNNVSGSVFTMSALNSDGATFTSDGTGHVTAQSFSGSGSGLTSLNASQINSGTLPLAQENGNVLTNKGTASSLTVSNTSNTGVLTVDGSMVINASYDTGAAVQANTINYTNVMWRNQWFAQQNKGVTRLPIRGIASWFGAYAVSSWTNTPTQTGISNAIAYMRQNLPGYNWVELDDGWGDSNLVNGTYMQCASNLQHSFGAGTNGVYNMITTIAASNINLILYADGGTNLSAGQFMRSMGAQYLTPNIDLWTRWGVSGLKCDMAEIQQEQVAATISTNGYPIYLSGAADGNFDGLGNGPLARVYPAMFNATRVVSGGDITSYSQLIRWMDVSQTNKWNYLVEPGRFIDMDFTGGPFTANYGINSIKAHLIAIALYSSPQLLSGPLFNGSPWYTNLDLAAIQQDPGVYCAQRFLQVSNCDIYLKPLGTQTGPEWALGVFNRSSTLATNVSFSLNALAPLAISGVQNWSVFDCISNGVDGSSGRWLGAPTNYITVALNTNDAALFRLVPNVALITNVIAVNFPYSMTVNVVSNGVPFTCYVPIDAMSSNYLEAAQLTNNTTSEAFEIAAAQTTALGMAHGWLPNLDILHLYMGGTSNSTAQNFISQTVGAIAWTSTGVTYNQNSVTGNGSSGYGTSTFQPSGTSQNFQLNSGMMFSYVKSTSVSGNNAMMGGNNGSAGGAGLTLKSAAPTQFQAIGINNASLFSLAANYTIDGVTGNSSGWWMAQRTSSAFQEVFHNTALDASDSSASTSLGPQPFYFLAWNGAGSPNYFFGGTIGCDGIGSSLTQAQWIQMYQDLQSIKAITGN